MTISGNMDIKDANCQMQGNITIPSGGGLYMRDTDGDEDGILTMTGGGTVITNSGDLFLYGFTTTGGGNTITNNSVMFLGDVTLYNNNNDKLDISSGAKLFFCGNKTVAGR